MSDHSFAPSVINGYNSGSYQGDYIGVTSVGSNIVPLWMDNFSGIYQAWTSNVMVIGINNNNNQLPSSYLLAQNYPNPFNPVTKIKFDIPKTGFVSLTVFDNLGREISALINENLNPGTYEADWDASNYASGVYFYRLEAGSFIETKKMLLVK